MKKIMGCSLLVLTMAVGANSVFAHDGHKACRAVWKACVKAGKKGKDAKACVETIKSGGSVDGVTVSDADLNACKAASEKKQTEGGSNS